ncbi:MAG: TatD family hydrolase [Candidatus Woesearchaeota archaeon]
MLYDAHCHLDKLQNPKQAVQEAQEAGLKLIVTNGLNPENNREALRLQEEFGIVKAALGLYPNDAIELSEEELEAELAFIKQTKPFAIGEIGLDYHWDKEHKEKMREVFRKCLVLAQEISRPAIIHSRKAEEDVLAIVEEFSVVACLHCFSGSKKLIKQAASAKHYFSVPANVASSTHFRMLVELVPINQLLLETDSPYLGPSRGVENAPRNVQLAIPVIAQIKGLDEQETRTQLWLNQKRFFA